MVTSDAKRDPAILSGVHVIPPFIGFFRDPIRTALRLSAAHGDFVKLQIPCAVGRMPSSVIFTAAAPHFREILGDTGKWRTVNIAAAGRRGHASSRLSKGLVRMRGARHEHYRRLITPPLRRASVLNMSESLGRTAERICERWPQDETVDLLSLSRGMVRELAALHLFGDGDEEALQIARMISDYVAASWSLSINLLRLDVAGTPYRKFLRLTEALESRILDWAARKKGEIDPQDLLSIVVNSNDENGDAPGERIVCGHVPTLFGAAYETCQNALIWSLILVATHPRVEASLRDEISTAIGAGRLTLEKVDGLPFLDAVTKETFRILPPVPNQYRVAVQDTSLSAFPIDAGTRAVLCAFVLNRNPSIYTSPARFVPDRWAKIEPSPFQYAVFSAGPRACPGFGFGNAVLKVALAAIIRRHRLTIDEHSRIGYKVTVSLSPHPSVPVRLSAPGRVGESPPIQGRIRDLVQFPH